LGVAQGSPTQYFHVTLSFSCPFPSSLKYLHRNLCLQLLFNQPDTFDNWLKSWLNKYTLKSRISILGNGDIFDY
jgi:hypothetical protein